MRIRIVGAGVAGLTLAALLRRHGKMPVVVERRSRDADPGYVMVGPLIRGLTEPI
ncbi:MAG: NAD(P)-binding protein [Gemmatimonadales bacterium]|nr:NAD(P)-binding protein [Gemmatimonadales bacterium]MBA3553687.1 NAD(P)-binding protein [Gemmatimonadales bacterium]